MNVFGLWKFEKEAHRAIIFDIRHGTDAEWVVVSTTGDVRRVFFDSAGETLRLARVEFILLQEKIYISVIISFRVINKDET